MCLAPVNLSCLLGGHNALKNLMDAPYMKMTAIDYVSVQISHQLPETYVRE